MLQRLLCNLVTLAAGGFLAACAGEDVAPPTDSAPPYLAIVTKVDAADGVFAGAEYRFRVREQSGALGVDTVLVAPTLVDTLILSVPNQSANYEITIEGVPDKCASRYGDATVALVPANSNTTLVRYFIICKPLIQLFVQTDGVNRDDAYLFRLTGPGIERIGQVEAQDTLLLEDLPPGAYRLDMGGIASNCVPISDGFDVVQLDVPAGGGVRALFRATCSDPASRPTITGLRATYGNGWVGAAVTVTDPDRDIDHYAWTVTDCAGRAVIAAGIRSYRGILASRGSADTVSLPLALETGEDVPEARSRCLALRVYDRVGNSTPFREVRLAPNDPAAPLAPESFDASIVEGQTVLRIALALDLRSPRALGVFPTVLLRDGILSPADGSPDTGIYGIAGYQTTALPDVRLGTRFEWYDVLASELYVVDTRGNLRLVRDQQFFP
jgi:hypothetical protein